MNEKLDFQLREIVCLHGLRTGTLDLHEEITDRTEEFRWMQATAMHLRNTAVTEEAEFMEGHMHKTKAAFNLFARALANGDV